MLIGDWLSGYYVTGEQRRLWIGPGAPVSLTRLEFPPRVTGGYCFTRGATTRPFGYIEAYWQETRTMHLPTRTWGWR